MIAAVAIVKGYQFEIRNKITGFSKHIQISRLDFNNSFETIPVYRDTLFEKTLQRQPNVSDMQVFGIKAGIIKTKTEFEGVVLKGVNDGYNWSFLKGCMIDGEVPAIGKDEVSNDIIISKRMADKLGLKTGDPLMVYFVQDPPRARRFNIKGIFSTGFDDLDGLYAMMDLRHIQKLNQWDSMQVTGYEVSVKDFDLLTTTAEEVLGQAPYNFEVKTVYQVYPQLFDWLGLLDLNVIVIIILMVIVACINMSTALLILIVERSNMIGMLKAMGANNGLVRRVFVYMASRLVITGLLIGNLVGVGLCISQKYLGWFKLEEDAYYLNEVPVLIGATDLLLINAGSFILCVIVLLLPAGFVSKINPVKAIRFE